MWYNFDQYEHLYNNVWQCHKCNKDILWKAQWVFPYHNHFGIFSESNAPYLWWYQEKKKDDDQKESIH